MRRIKLTREEKEIEEALIKWETIPASKEEFEKISEMLKRFKKDAVLNIRVNSNDLALIKRKAHKLGVKYQTLISEFLHRLAHS